MTELATEERAEPTDIEIALLKRADHRHFLALNPEAGEAGIFMAHKAVNRWAVIKMARAEASGDDAKQAGAFYDLVMTIVLPEERERLDDYMMEHGDDDGMQAMSLAVGRFVKGETGLPLAPSQDLSNASTATNSDTGASLSEPVTGVVVTQRANLATGEIRTVDPTSLADLSGV